MFLPKINLKILNLNITYKSKIMFKLCNYYNELKDLINN